MLLSPEDREAIRARVPLEDLARDYDIHLIPAGRKFKALCPFHQEKTPSFSIDVDKQFYYCFGCESGGDVFRFVQELDRVGFVESVEILARRAGVVLDRSPRGRERSERRLGLYDALEFAAEYYRRVLAEDARGGEARAYLQRRGMTPEMLECFRLGFSLPDWDGLVSAATRAGHDLDTLERAGLARHRQDSRGGYDYFRGRVMFPISDPQNRVIGFGARTLGDDQPKYLNTPSTPLFDKSQVLYGLSRSRAGIRRESAIAVVEGYTDAIMAHQAGLDFFVASLGTAFTKENASALRRQAPRVYMIFDGDTAGQNAAERSLDLLVVEEIEVRVYTVTDGKDPCDAVLALGGEAFRRAMEADSVDLFEYKWRATVGSSEAQASPQARSRAVSSFLGLVAGVKNPVTQRLILREYIERLGVRESDVESELVKARQNLRRSARVVAKDGAAGARPSVAAAVRHSGGGQGADGALSSRSGVSGLPAKVVERDSRPEDAPLHQLAEVVLECLLVLPSRAPSIWDQVPEGLFVGSTGEALCSAVEKQVRVQGEGGSAFSGVTLMQNLEDPEAKRVVIKLLSQLESEDDSLWTDHDARWRNCQRDLRRHGIRQRIDALKRESKQAVGEPEEVADRRAVLAREVTHLRKKLKKT